MFYQLDNGISNNTVIELDIECLSKEHMYLIVSNVTKDQQQNLNQLLFGQVTSSEDVERLLDYVNWNIYVYSSKQVCHNFTNLASEVFDVCSNLSCCFTNSTDDIFQFSSQCGNTSCTDSINSYAISRWFVLLIFGILCLIGNVAVMCNEIFVLRGKLKKVKEVQIYHVLVFNLALADFLMGIYLTGIAFEIEHKISIGVYYSKPDLCNLLGVLNSVSSQVSLTILFIISSYRLVGVLWPYEQPRLKLVMILIILTWITWLVISALPLIPLEPFKSTFTYGLVKDRKVDRNTVLDFAYMVSVLQARILPSFRNVAEVKFVLQSVIQFPTPSVMEKFFSALGLIDSQRENWHLVGYYDFKYTCSADFNVFNKHYRYSNHLAFAFLFYNLVVSIAILFSYIVVAVKIYENDISRFIRCKWWVPCCFSCSCRELSGNVDLSKSLNCARSAENRKILKRISFIVFTDLMCWIPLCIASLIIWGTSLPDQIKEEFDSDTIAFQTVQLIVVPLNSVLNPYIYSGHLWMRLYKNLKNKFCTA